MMNPTVPAMRLLAALVLLCAPPASAAEPPAEAPPDWGPTAIDYRNVTYPYPVSYLGVALFGDTHRMAYMDVPPSGPANGQTAVLFQKDLAQKLGLSESNVRICCLNTGGAFSGRVSVKPHHYLAALLSRKAGRPVKIMADADEEFIVCRSGGCASCHRWCLGGAWPQRLRPARRVPATSH